MVGIFLGGGGVGVLGLLHVLLVACMAGGLVGWDRGPYRV